MNESFDLHFQDLSTLRAIFDEIPNPHRFEFLSDFDGQLRNGIQFEVPSWSFAADKDTGEILSYLVTYSDPVVYPSGAIGGYIKCSCPDAVCRRKNGEALGCTACKHAAYLQRTFLPPMLYHILLLTIWGENNGYAAA